MESESGIRLVIFSKTVKVSYFKGAAKTMIDLLSPFYYLSSFRLMYWVTPQVIFIFFLWVTWTIYLWETYLTYREYTLNKQLESVPAELDYLNETVYEEAKTYGCVKTTMFFYYGIWKPTFQTVVLCCKGLPCIWYISERIINYFGYTSNDEIKTTAVFCVLEAVVNGLFYFLLTYSMFVFEKRHRLYQQETAFCVSSKVAEFITKDMVVYPVATCIIVYLVKFQEDLSIFVYIWIFCAMMSIFIATLYKDFILPLFDNTTPLPESELRTGIEELAACINFPLKEVYVVQGSKRFQHSGVWISGRCFTKKRILIDATVLRDVDKYEEVLAVVAHEFGHWKYCHHFKNIVIVQIQLFLGFVSFAAFFQNKMLYAAIGFMYDEPVVAELVFRCEYIFFPFSKVLSFLLNILTHRFELQADAFVKKQNKASDLRNALVKLNRDNLEFLIQDKYFSALRYPYPTLLQRVRALGKID